MILQIDFIWLVALLLAFFGAAAGAAKIMLGQSQRHQATLHKALTDRLDAIEVASREEASQWQRVEREFLRFQAELPVHYVRREDYIRGQSVIEAKLDGLATKLENAQLRGMIHGATS